MHKYVASRLNQGAPDVLKNSVASSKKFNASDGCCGHQYALQDLLERVPIDCLDGHLQSLAFGTVEAPGVV
jgi:hypothetical protein